MADDLTAEQAAALLGYHLNHLYRLLKEGTVKGRKLAGKVWLVDRSEVVRVKALQDENGRLSKGQR